MPTLTGLTGLAAQVRFSGFVMLEGIHDFKKTCPKRWVMMKQRWRLLCPVGFQGQAIKERKVRKGLIDVHRAV